MQAYRVNTTIQEDGTLTVSHLPLQSGEVVEVIILVRASTARPQDHYPLRGTSITYIDPTEPVAEADWEAAR
jgi:NADPH:quinone reductase-like Zn-dependent oxidoreductase